MWDKLWKQELAGDAVLVSSAYNMRYLSSFCGGEGYVFLHPKRQVVIVDSRYTTQAKEEASGFEVIEIGGDVGFGDVIRELASQTGTSRLLFEDSDLTYSTVRGLKEKCGELEWIPAGELLNNLRWIKSEEELARIEKAEAIGDKAFARILNDIRPGITELEVAAKLEYYMREEGTAKNSFDTIVASGLHSAMPHAIPTDKKIEAGDFVTMDFGCVYQGYCSDMTRTVVVGKANDRQKELYQIVLEAQQAGISAIRAGMTGSQVDAVSRDIIKKAGYGEYFGHGLGHSVGLVIHEEPRLSPKCHEVLRENMIQTVEPGIYIPGFGGVRIEDLVCVTADGCVNYTHSPKELIEL